MLFLLNKVKSFIFIVFISLSSISAYAVSCSIIKTPINLDGSYVKGLEALGTALSEPVIGKKNLRQTLSIPARKTGMNCTGIRIVNNNGKSVRAVFLNDDMSLQGLIINDRYYHFKDAKIRVLDKISHSYVADLKGKYETAQGISISYETINSAVDTLNDAHGEVNMKIRQSLARIMFVTTEALRFRSISDVSVKMLNKEHKDKVLWKDYALSIKNWESLSEKALKEGIVVPKDLQSAIGTKNDVQIAKRIVL
ncbi:MAG: ribosome-inactivating family protein [Alphaproteobacteria bacterium]|jgi:hypothetical protein|nr:ribosome-inactivating family protein [Alphaproteobacteria bacterium]